MLLTPASIQQQINKSIKNYSFGNKPPNLYEPISYIMDLGGKRLRPMLVIYAYSLFKNEIDKIINQALVVEVFHNFTLMHDDIMDNADLRRNKPTVHKKWNDSVAILSGDVMLVKAYQMMENLPENQFQKIYPAFNTCAAGVCEGQQMDMDFSLAKNVSMDEYIEMIRLKTAILLGYSLELGGIMAETSTENIAQLKLFGEKIGLAFQIADDYLDAYGEAEKFGKKVGGDIIENKKTFLTIKALELAKPKQKQKLLELYSSKTENEANKIQQVMAIFDELEISIHTQNAINSYFEQGMQHLKQVKCDIFRKGLLKKFVSELMQRQN